MKREELIFFIASAPEVFEKIMAAECESDWVEIVSVVISKIESFGMMLPYEDENESLDYNGGGKT